jgi:hypothetical protein
MSAAASTKHLLAHRSAARDAIDAAPRLPERAAP